MESLPFRDLAENVHGPLYGFVLHYWTRLAGASEWAMRLPSALFGAAMVPVMAALAGRWLGPRTAPWAAWLTALSPFLVWYSQEARNYALLMLCVGLAGVALLQARERPGPGAVLRVFAAVAAGLLSGFSFALLAPLHLKWWLADRATRGRRLLILAAGMGALALVLLPWIPHVLRIWDFRRLVPGGAEGTTPLRGATTFHPAALPWALHAFAVGYTLGPSLRELRESSSTATLLRHAPELLLVAVVFGALFVLGIRALARRGRLLDAALWLIVPALLVSWFATRNFKVFHPRYLAVCAPLVLLAFAAALTDLKPRARIAMAVAVGLLWGVSLYQHAFVPRYGKEDYRGAAVLVARATAGEKVLAVGAEDPLFYYYRGPAPLERFWLGHVARPTRLAEEWSEARAGTDGVWVVLSRSKDLDPEGRFARFIEAQDPEAFRLEGVRVWHLRGPAAAAKTAPAR